MRIQGGEDMSLFISVRELVDLLRESSDNGTAYVVSETDHGLLIEVLLDEGGIARYTISTDELLTMSAQDFREIRRIQTVPTITEYMFKVEHRQS